MMFAGILRHLRLFVTCFVAPADPAQEALPFLTFFTHFISCTRPPNYVREATRRVAEKTPTIDTDGGAQLLAFSQDLGPVYLQTAV